MSMKRRLLAALTAATILYDASQPAYALFGVGDLVFDPASYGELADEAQQGLEELKWLADLYGDAEKTIKQLVNFYNLFAHITDATQLAQVLNSNFIKSPLLGDALHLEQAFSGHGLTTTLAAKVQAVVNKLQYYQPSNNDFAGFSLNQRTTATAGQVASAQDAFDAETQRTTGLATLELGINTADPKRVADIGARASIEVATAISQTNKLVASSIMQSAQNATNQQQQEQAYRFSNDALAQSAQNSAANAYAGNVTLMVP